MTTTTTEAAAALAAAGAAMNGEPVVQTHPSQTAPLCKDCAHSTLAWDGEGAEHATKAWMCQHPFTQRNLVTGAPKATCANARGGRICGPEGRAFEPASPLKHPDKHNTQGQQS